jgi:cytochrome c-type biogenesis protein CcsB
MVDAQLAALSNQLIYSALAVYSLALIFFAIDLSGRGAGGRRGQPERELAAVGAVAPSASGASASSGSVSGGEAGGRTAGSSRAGGIAVALTWLAAGLQVAGVVARGLAVHRVPWSNMYEFSISGSAVIAVIFLGLLTIRDVRYLGTFVVGPIVLVLGLAVVAFYTEATELSPALHSYWLIIHVSVAFIASALFTLGFSTSVLQVVQENREQARAAGREPKGGAFMDRLPPSLELQRSAYRLHVVAFPLWTVTVILGAVWAQEAWGTYWNWDPKEVWSFVIWVVYAAYLHARVTRGWSGRRAAYISFVGFGCLVFNFIGVNILFTGLHTYSGL